jgi:TetR/AcrR family transcriptional repressor of mexJK operon
MLAELAAGLEQLGERGLLRTRGVAASHFFGLLLWIPINRVMFRGEDEGLTSAEGDRLVDEDVRACLGRVPRPDP